MLFLIMDYFHVIDTEEKAYWLGFLYADGCVFISNHHSYSLILELSSVDKEHIQKFKTAIASDTLIKETQRDNRHISRLCIGNKELVCDLISHGCVPKKTLILDFPTIISQNLIRHFIRGYFDGDGCLSVKSYYHKQRKKDYLSYSWFILGTRDLLSGMINYLPIKLDIVSVGKICRIRTQSLNNIKIILDYLYKDATIYLQRKYDKYIDYVKYA